MLEASQYGDNAFVTLTYDDEHLPEGLSVVPNDLSAFMKRLRKHIQPRRVRYYGVGEYGDETERPHYHLALFGHPTCQKGLTSLNTRKTCCEICDTLRMLWARGNVYAGDLSSQSASYIAGYVTKKWTSPNHEDLRGRHPEFARMSLRPGIGAGMMDDVASALMEHNLDTLPDVPASLAHGRQRWPLGRYLRGQLRKKIGRDEKAPLSTIKEMEEKLRPMREYAAAHAPRGFKSDIFKATVIACGEGSRRNIIARHNRSRKRGSV